MDGGSTCNDLIEEYNSFRLYVEKSTSVGSGSLYNSADGCHSLSNDKKKEVSEATYIKLAAVLCNGTSFGDGNIAVGSCHRFESLSSTPIQQGIWTFIAFTYDPFLNIGTFFINDVYGYEEFADVSKENAFFTFETKQWLSSDSVLIEP